MKKLLNLIGGAALFAASTIMPAHAQDAPKPEQKQEQKDAQKPESQPARPSIVQYARSGDALPEGTTFLGAGYGKAVKDMQGSNAQMFGQFALPEHALTLGMSLYDQSIGHKESEVGNEFFDFGGGNTQTIVFNDILRNDIDRKVIHVGAQYRGFGIDVANSRLKLDDLTRYDETSTSSTSGTDTFLEETASAAELKTTTGALRYSDNAFAAALGMTKQTRKVAQRAIDSGSIGSIPFDFSLEDTLRDETARSTFFASGAYTVVPELSVGLDLAYGKITDERATSHVEMENGAVIDSSSTGSKDTRNPFYVRANGIWVPQYLPLIVSAGVGGITSNNTDDSQAMADLGLTLKAGNIGIYAMAGIDAEGEAYFTGAIGAPRQGTHDLGRFLADQRTLFPDEASQLWDFQNRVHGLAQQGTIVGANTYLARDGFEPGDIRHFQPFIGIPFSDYGALVIVGNMTEEGGSGRVRLGFDIGKSIGIDSIVLGADLGISSFKSVETETAARPKLQYGEYAVTVGWGKNF